MLSTVSGKQKLTIMIGVMAAMLLSALDQTIVATAMPRIVAELKGLEHLSWVFTAYMLTSTITVPIYGKLSDMYGRKGFFISGIIIFLLGSALSGLSQNMTELILFRGLQGIGGGAIMANAFAIIGDLFPPAERGKWQGLMGAVFGLSSVIGPTLGGFLTDNFSWRWNFYINVPVGIVALGLIIFLMPKIDSHLKERTIDYLGAIVLSISLVALLLGCVWGGSQYAWTSWQELSIFGLSFFTLLFFGFVEQKATDPILPLSLFKNSIFTLSMFITFISGVAMFGTILYIPLFAQIVMGVSATNSGTIITPLMIGMVISSIITGQVISKTGKYKWIAVIGLLVMTVALYLLSLMTGTSSQEELIIKMIITGLGLGTTFPVFTIAVQNTFEHSKLGVVTAASQLFRSIGGTVGAAIMGSIFNNALLSHLGNLSSDPFVQIAAKMNSNFNLANLDINKLQGFLTPQVQEQIQSQLSKLPPSLASQILGSYSQFLAKLKEAVALSVDQIFLIATFLMAIAFLSSFFLKQIPLRKSHSFRPGLEEAGIELAAEQGDFAAEDEPELD